MICRLEMPFVDPMVRRFRLLTWLKSEGDAVTYGDDLCELTVEEVRVLKRASDARRLASVRQRVRPAVYEGYRNRKRGSFRLRLTSSDQGFLRRIEVRENQEVEVGDLLAVTTTDPDEPIEGRPASSFRLVSNRVDPEEQ